MRADLQTMERVEAYVNGFMTSPEKEQFETELNTSSDLQMIVEHQQMIQQAVARKAIMAQVHQFAPATISSISFWTKFKWPIILSSIMLMALVGFSFISNVETKQDQEKEAKKTLISEKNSEIVNPKTEEKLPPDSPCKSAKSEISLDDSKGVNSTNLDGLYTWVTPDKQIFDLNPGSSHTLECKNGTLIIVPKNAFIDKEGNTITEIVQLEVVEALNVADMLAYNLTTMNNEKVLQSGGMLYVQPRLNGEKVEIDADKPLHIEVPTQKIVPEMMAWKGVVDQNGDINWEEPKAIKRYLVPVNFNTLDFLPEGFANTVDAGLPFKNYKKSSSSLIDSLYYSLAVEKNSEVRVLPISNISKDIKKSKGKMKDVNSTLSENKVPLLRTSDSLFINVESKIISPVIVPMDTKFDLASSTMRNNINICYINPLSVKAVKSIQFANTFIATKEFEERLHELHKIPNAQECFDLYLNNLAKNLSDVDQMVANKLSGKHKATFQSFANEKLTNVDNDDINQEDLKAYYNSSREKFQKEVNKVREQCKSLTEKELTVFQNQLNKLNRDYYKSTVVQNSKGKFCFPQINVGNRNIEIPQMTVATTPSYKLSWNSCGWVNIDAYLHLLSYGEQIVSIDAQRSLPNVRVFQCINFVKTVVPLNNLDGKYEAHFPKEGQEGSESMKDTYCVGIQQENNQLYFSEKKYNPYIDKTIHLDWASVTELELHNKLRQISPMNDVLITGLNKEKENIAKEIERRKEQEKLDSIKKIKEAEYRKEQERLNAIIEAKQLEIAKENAFIQSLIDKINPCNPDFGKEEECEQNFENSVDFGI